MVSTFASRVPYPTGLAFDGSGNLYVTDYSDGIIYKVTPAGVVSTFITGFNDDPIAIAMVTAPVP